MESIVSYFVIFSNNHVPKQINFIPREDNKNKSRRRNLKSPN